MSTTYNHRKGTGFASAMARSAASRRCPECGRKSAVQRWSDDSGITRFCRWCEWATFRSWDEIYAEIDARRNDAGT